MKKLISLGSVAAVLMMTFGAMSSAQAADTKPMGSQQSKMATCATENKGKTGDDYKGAMKSCLSSKPVAATQQTKMKTCATANKGKKGDDYKSSMSTCLKG